MKLAPVILFAHKRPDHTRRVIAALQNCDLATESDLIVYSDAARTEDQTDGVVQVRQLLRKIRGFASVEIRERESNWGLSRSLTSGLCEVLTEHGRAIVIEDDLEVSPHFLSFMNEGLSLYENDMDVASIHGYIYPVKKQLPETFFLRGADCWGWATWRRAWLHYRDDSSALLGQLRRRRLVREFDLGGAFPFSRMLEAQSQGRVDSWAIRWHASAFLDDMYTLYPGQSLVQNIGTDGSGEHSGSGNAYRVSLSLDPIEVKRIPVAESLQARLQFSEFLRSQRPSYGSRARRRLARSLRLS